MTVLSTAILGQFEAALSVLGQALAECGEEDLSAPHPDAPFSQVVFHALIFTDVYLGWDEEAVKTQGFHLDHRDEFLDYEELQDREPLRTYGRTFLREYLGFCLAKARTTLALESDAVLGGGSGFSYRKFSRLELHLYSIRHVQHHAAQLGLRNQLATGNVLRWASSGWRDPWA
jgi:hypothetical protein